MTTLTWANKILPSARFGGESSLPSVSARLRLTPVSDKFRLDENDGLFINYGVPNTVFPYKMQDMYDRGAEDTEWRTVTLENEYLKAVFMPDLGGKLWSLTDKTRNRELLFANDAVRPCNLASRNAWLSGGVEWNAGFLGHSPFTCSPISVAQTKLNDSTPVLRFYYFERIRAVAVQMDFFLPEESRLLFARMRITNPNNEVVPMYWWSNVGVTEHDGDRVVVPAVQSYTCTVPQNEVIKVDIPTVDGKDITYPDRNDRSIDWFWKTDSSVRPYIYQADPQGYGLMQTSTSRLKGRKLFVWGNSQGGHKWMNFLTSDDKSGRYNEIQSGLAHTQYESLPMPPHTVWEWLEGYGALAADKDKIHGDWIAAQKETEARIDEIITAERMEQILCDTRDMAKSHADTVSAIDGYGALERIRRKKCGEDDMNAHLDFGNVGAEQSDWVKLLDSGTVGYHDPDSVPASYMLQKEWIDLLNKAVKGKDRDNWYAHYLLGAAAVAEGEYDTGEKRLKKSLALCDSVWAHYALGVLYGCIGSPKKETEQLLAAYGMRPYDLSIAKETMRVLYKNKLSRETVSLYENATASVQSSERCKLYYAYALLRTGRVDEAEEILCGKDGKTYLVVPDLRECETIITDLWYDILASKGISREKAGEMPRELDFRMFAVLEKE